MAGYKKVAVTVPAGTFALLERARGKLGKSRSEAVSLAIDDWLQGLEAGAARKRYVDGYLRHPETPDELESAARVAAAATADWSAWEPGAASRAGERRTRTKR
jgi:hypothetical protein